MKSNTKTEVIHRCLRAGESAGQALSALDNCASRSEVAALCAPSAGAYISLAGVLESAISAIGESSVTVRGLVSDAPELVYPLMTSARIALIAANRLGYLLLAPSAPQRDEHAREVIAKDAKSGLDYERAAGKFTDLPQLAVLSDQVKVETREGKAEIGYTGDGVSDNVLAQWSPPRVARLYLARARASGMDFSGAEKTAADRLPTNWSEGVRSLWNLSSGYAHAHAWPNNRDEPSDQWENVGLVYAYADRSLRLFTDASVTPRSAWDAIAAHAEADPAP